MLPSAYIDDHADRLRKTLRDLVAVPTVNPPGRDYEPISARLTRELAALGLKTRRYPIPDALLRKHLPAAQHGFPRFNVLGRLAVPGAKKTIHFNAHYDVVPVSGRWRHADPFSGKIAAGWIYGRGTADMKGSIASLLLALEALRATGTRPRLNIEVSFTADEETDSVLGSGWLVRHAPIRPDFAVVMEGGEGDSVCCGHNGVIWLEVAIRGLAAHGSTPERGINALEKMSALVLALGDYKKKIGRRKLVSPEGKVMRPTINVGGVFSAGEGGKVNTVPAHASFTIDRRVLAIEDRFAAERELRAFLAAAARKIPQCRITVKKFSENLSCFHAPKHPFFAAMAESVSRVRGRPAGFNISTGFNDMHFFSHYLKIPTLGYGPGGDHEHGVDERARIRDLLDSAKIYADLLTSFGG
jgi:succinyl-diaminopimelate desuccinylase